MIPTRKIAGRRYSGDIVCSFDPQGCCAAIARCQCHGDDIGNIVHRAVINRLAGDDQATVDSREQGSAGQCLGHVNLLA